MFMYLRLLIDWSSLRTEDLSVPLSLWLPPCQHRVVSPHLFQNDQCPRLPFTLKWLVLWEALTQSQGLSSICNGVTWSAEGGLLPAAVKGFLQVPIWEPNLRVRSPHLEDVGSSCHWVVDAIDGEENWGQGIDDKTWNSAVRERRRVVGPGDPCCVGRLGVTLWYDP